MPEVLQPEWTVPCNARFDTTLDAWILSSYADVSVALRAPWLASGTVTYATAHAELRDAAAKRFSGERLAAWHAEIEPLAHSLAGELPAGQAVDLVRAFAGPWSLAAALAATDAPGENADRLADLAREVFLSAASATDCSLRPRAQEAASELAHSFPSAGASVDVQAFVALSQTLPCFLANAWFELLRHPEETSRLRSQPGLMPQAIEELLRYAGPSRAVFRQAAAPAVIGCANIREGDRVILLPGAANRDPAQFAEPDRLMFDRGAGGHLALGAGAHFCVGAPLVRMAAAVATTALLATADALESGGPVDWMDGFAIRGPAALPVILRRARQF